MKYTIDKIPTPSGDKYELRVWGRGRGASQIKRRFESKSQAQDQLDEIIFEANKESKAAKQRLREGRTEDSDRFFVEELEYHEKHQYPTFAPGWKANYDGYKDELLPMLQERTIKEVNPELLDDIVSELRAKENSNKTINNKLGWLISILNYSLEKRRIQSHFVMGYKKLKVTPPEIEFWEQEDAISFLTWANEKYPAGSEKRWVFVAYIVTLNGGLRAGETWALKPACMKFDTMTLRITEQYNRVSKDFEVLKGKESRSVPMNEDVCKELQALIRQKNLTRHSVFFSTESGAPIDHDNFARDFFDKDVKAWKGPRITFHGLRHTAATLMLLAGVDLSTVSKILGHKDEKTTTRYLHLVAKRITQVAQNFALLPEKKQPELRLVSE